MGDDQVVARVMWTAVHLCGLKRRDFPTREQAEAWVIESADPGDGLGGCWDVYPTQIVEAHP